MSVKTIIKSGKNRVYRILSKHLKLYRVIAAVIAFAMIIGLVFFANSLFNYPLSEPFFKLKAKNYIKENYGGMGYVLESFQYFGSNYFAEAAKPGSLDSRFTVHGYADGYIHDSYEHDILKLGSVGTRLDKQYKDLADNVFESPLFPYKTNSHALLAVETYYNDPRYESKVPHDILVLDGIYDIRELGKIGGYLNIGVDTDQLTPEKAAEALLEIDRLMTQGGVTYYAVNIDLADFSVELQDRKYYRLRNFRRIDIYEEGLVERVIQNHQ